jgi:isopentenyldiphosphate isomerase
VKNTRVIASVSYFVPMASDEVFPLVDEEGRVVGSARRAEVHGNPTLIHPVVHCLVEDDQGRLLLQHRSLNKDIQPGRWDTSVGGHVAFGESIDAAIVREIEEELGVSVRREALRSLYRYVMRSAIETELVHTFAWTSNGPFRVEPGEASELRFFTRAEIEARLGTGFFTPNFEDEYLRYRTLTTPQTT